MSQMQCIATWGWPTLYQSFSALYEAHNTLSMPTFVKVGQSAAALSLHDLTIELYTALPWAPHRDLWPSLGAVRHLVFHRKWISIITRLVQTHDSASSYIISAKSTIHGWVSYRDYSNEIREPTTPPPPTLNFMTGVFQTFRDLRRPIFNPHSEIHHFTAES